MNNLDIRAEAALRVPDVFHRRKIQRAGDDLVSVALFKIETRGHAGERDRSVRLNLHGTRLAADHMRNAIADARRHLPPARSPGVFTGVLFPGFVVSEHRLARRTRHWAQAVT